MDYDDLELLHRVKPIDSDTETFRGIDLGSVWTVRGEVKDDTYSQHSWLAAMAEAAGWWVGCYAMVSSGDSARQFYAAREPRIEVRLTHLGEGDSTVLGTCSAREANGILRLLNGKTYTGTGSVAECALVEAARVANEKWRARGDSEGTPSYSGAVAPWDVNEPNFNQYTHSSGFFYETKPGYPNYHRHVFWVDGKRYEALLGLDGWGSFWSGDLRAGDDCADLITMGRFNGAGLPRDESCGIDDGRIAGLPEGVRTMALNVFQRLRNTFEEA